MIEINLNPEETSLSTKASDTMTEKEFYRMLSQKRVFKIIKNSFAVGSLVGFAIGIFLFYHPVYKGKWSDKKNNIMDIDGKLYKVTELKRNE